MTNAKRTAATVLITDGGWIVGLATENEPGYLPLNYGPFEDKGEAEALATRINVEAYGLDKHTALLVVVSSVFPLDGAGHARRCAEWSSEDEPEGGSRE